MLRNTFFFKLFDVYLNNKYNLAVVLKFNLSAEREWDVQYVLQIQS